MKTEKPVLPLGEIGEVYMPCVEQRKVFACNIFLKFCLVKLSVEWLLAYKVQSGALALYGVSAVMQTERPFNADTLACFTYSREQRS